MLADLRSALRGFTRNPGSTLVAVLTLALGIGGTTAIFTLADAVLLKTLPVQAPRQLVVLDKVRDDGSLENLSFPFFERLRDDSDIFAGVLAVADGTWEVPLVGPEPASTPETVALGLVSGRYFEVLGVVPAAGRFFGAAEERREPAGPVSVVLNHDFWARRFGRDPSVVGKPLVIQDQAAVIAGVAPPGFFGETVGRSPDVWTPLPTQPAFLRGSSYLDGENIGWLRVFGRLPAGMPDGEARVRLDTFVARLRKDNDDHPARVQMTDGSRGTSPLRARFGTPLQILSAAVALVLIIVCANVSNLLLARMTARRREVAIRMASGAGRGRLLRQFLVESLMLSVAGSAAGLLVAMWGSRVLVAMASGDAPALPIDVSPDLRVVGFAMVAGVTSALIFGLAPAWIASRVDVQTTLKSTNTPAGRARLPRALIVAQIAICLVLLTAAGLFVRTLANLRARELGFGTTSLALVRIATEGYKPRSHAELKLRLLDELTAVPGVESASIGFNGFAGRGPAACCIAVEGHTPARGENREMHTIDVAPGYFETVRMPIVQGRDFTAADRVDDPRLRPVKYIVNQAFVRRYFAGASPIGKRFGWGDPPAVRYDNEIVGVVGDVVHVGPRETAEPRIYVPSLTGNWFVARTGVPPESVLPAIRRAFDGIDRKLVIAATSFDAEREKSVTQEALLARLATFFGVLAMALAAVGLFGLMAYTVARRVRDIGVRMALGADAGAILRAELRSALWLAVAGIALGVPIVWAAGRFVSSQLFGISAVDPLTIGAGAAMVLAVSIAAAYVPARRAARVDPIRALRAE